MKYSLTPHQPAVNASVTARSRSSSVTFLLMTSRMRCVPASGAKVSPPFRTVCIFSRSSFKIESMRSDGKDTDTFCSAMSSMIRGKSACSSE